MASRFIVPDSSPAPSTPDKHAENRTEFSFLPDLPSTTPAGPPPSSRASFTPAGAPSEPYFGSSIPRGADTGSKPFAFGARQSQNRSAGRNLFGRKEGSNATLDQSIRGRGRQPSSLSRQYSFSDDEEAEEDQDVEKEVQLPPHSLFRQSSAPPNRVEEEDEDAEGEDVEAEISRYLDEEMEADEEAKGDVRASGAEDDGPTSEEESNEGDIFLNMQHDDRPYDQPIIGEGDDLIMLNTPAATERVRKEAEVIFKRSSAQVGGFAPNKEVSFAAIAMDMYTQQDAARITEPRDLILKTEDLVCRLYNEGIGAKDDAEKMDNSLANITYQLISLWNNHVEELPQPEGEDFATIGPGKDAEPFEKAAYVAQLILRIHHNRFENDGEHEKTTPLPETLFDWQARSHNLYPDQIREISRFKPSPACHNLYWQTLRNALLRGDVSGASQLLKNAGWENVSEGSRADRAYTGQALDNVRRFADATCEILNKCPAVRGDWDIWNSSWTLFRVQARGSLDKLALFAEGRDTSSLDGFYSPQPQSMSVMARRANGKIPWHVYENLQMVYGIILGDEKAVLEMAQDWCEATVGLVGWWDDGSQRHRHLTLPPLRGFGASGSRFRGSSEYLDRLGSAFRLVLQSDMSPDPMNAVEVAIASCFEGNVNGVIGLLRTWSLPVASSVAEVASLGQWLPPTEMKKHPALDSLDMGDLDVLGILPPTEDEIEGIKDTTLVLYARELAGIDHLSAQREGWEVAIGVLGRMDVPQKSEETVAELLRDLLATLDENSGSTVDRMWMILNDLGMITYAEESAECFADVLSKHSVRYGEALWYYALSHRPDKVRDVLNLLISYSLIHSAAFPQEENLDEDLRDLLRKRTETLERRAKQDLEAAQLLGRMLSGYATLRTFYDIRDGQKLDQLSDTKARAVRKQAAAALVAVISSADDNIRGGLYDSTRDAVVSEDFLGALLGEATVFVNQSPCLFSLNQIEIVLKAVEDLETVGSQVSHSCNTFLELVMRGSLLPAESLWKSHPFVRPNDLVMRGGSMLANGQRNAELAGGELGVGEWDWRRGWEKRTDARQVLRTLRLGLSKDLATLWLEDADGVAGF